MEREIEKHREYLRQRGYAESTIKDYGRENYKLISYLRNIRGKERVQDVTKEDLKMYNSYLYTLTKHNTLEKVSTSTIVNKLKALKGLFRYLNQNGDILYNPAEIIELPKRVTKHKRKALKERDIKRILAVANEKSIFGIRDRAILELLYASGVRNRELRHIKLSDVDLFNGEILIRKGKGLYGEKERVVPIGRIGTMYLEEYLEKSRPQLMGEGREKYLFLSKGGRKLDTKGILEILRKYADKAGIKKYVCVHILRHSCATHLLKGGANIRIVQELLGHKSIASTQVYTSLEISDLKKIHRRTHPRERI